MKSLLLPDGFKGNDIRKAAAMTRMWTFAPRCPSEMDEKSPTFLSAPPALLWQTGASDGDSDVGNAVGQSIGGKIQCLPRRGAGDRRRVRRRSNPQSLLGRCARRWTFP